MRSELWTASGTPEPSDDAAVPAVAAFLADAPFVVLVSTDADSHTDVSPRVDPPGRIRPIDDTTIAIADRPGNRRTDSLHNLMGDPRIALLAMKPGSRYVADIRGTARVCTDRALLESMRLRNRTPKVATARERDGARGWCRLRLPGQPLSARPRRPDGTAPQATGPSAVHRQHTGGSVECNSEVTSSVKPAPPRFDATTEADEFGRWLAPASADRPEGARTPPLRPRRCRSHRCWPPSGRRLPGAWRPPRPPSAAPPDRQDGVAAGGRSLC